MPYLCKNSLHIPVMCQYLQHLLFYSSNISTITWRCRCLMCIHCHCPGSFLSCEYSLQHSSSCPCFLCRCCCCDCGPRCSLPLPSLLLLPLPLHLHCHCSFCPCNCPLTRPPPSSLSPLPLPPLPLPYILPATLVNFAIAHIIAV
jgi:hypothetical protein